MRFLSGQNLKNSCNFYPEKNLGPPDPRFYPDNAPGLGVFGGPHEAKPAPVGSLQSTNKANFIRTLNRVPFWFPADPIFIRSPNQGFGRFFQIFIRKIEQGSLQKVAFLSGFDQGSPPIFGGPVTVHPIKAIDQKQQSLC